MEVTIPLAMTFLISLITAPSIARRRIDLSRWIICLRYSLTAGTLIALLMIFLALISFSEIDGYLSGFVLFILVIPTALLAAALGMAGASLGTFIGRQK
jgi:glucose-6-phosphate-specific signal transduction histidine kinase